MRDFDDIVVGLVSARTHAHVSTAAGSAAANAKHKPPKETVAV